MTRARTLRAATTCGAAVTMALLAGGPAALAAGCDVTYTGAPNGSWSVAADWSGGALPTTAQNACIPAGAGTVDVPAGAVATAATLTAQSGVRIEALGTLALADPTSSAAHVSALSDVTVLGTLSTAGSWISIAGDAVVDGHLAGPFATLVTLESGTLSGTGLIDPTFRDVAGTVQPGGAHAVGALTFGSVYSQQDQGTLVLDLASDASFDQLLPEQNNATLAGTIQVELLGAYRPAVGTTWDFITGSPGIQNLGWVLQPSAFAAQTIAHGAQLRLATALPADPDPPGDGGSSDPSDDPPPPPDAGGTPPVDGGGPSTPAPPLVTPLPPSPELPAAIPTPPAPEPAPAPAQQLLLGCTTRRLALNDVLQSHGRVRLDGSATTSLAGQRVTILFDDHQRVATATIGTDGHFAASAPLPPARLRTSNDARYVAVVGALRSLDLKLTRRLVLEPPRHNGRTVALVGQVIAPLASPVRSVTVSQQTTCGKAVTVKRFVPGAGGRFHITLPAPAGAPAALYRLSTSVRRSRTDRRSFATYSLPLPVRLG